MGEKVSTTVSRAQAYKACEKAGKKGTSKNKLCKKMVDVCLSQDADSYTLITPSGSITMDSQKQCIGTSVDLSSFGFELIGSKVKPKKAASQKSANGSQPHRPNRSKRNKKKEEADQKKPAEPIKSQTVCNKFAKISTAKHNACIDFVKVCTAKPNGPYTLSTSSGQITADDKESCVEVATDLADLGFEKGAVQKSRPKKEESPKSSAQPVEPDDDSVASEASPRFFKSFADIRLALRVTGDKYVNVKRTLLFQGGKGIPIWLRYSVRRKSDGQFRIRYTIFKGGKALESEQSLTFKADSGKINLAFEVALKSPENFGDVESIRIVDKSDQ